MFQLMNKDDLAQYIDYFNQEKITKMALEHELSTAINNSGLEHVGVFVQIVESPTTRTFIISPLPGCTANGRTDLMILIDKVALTLFSSNVIVDLLENECRNYQIPIKMLFNFMEKYKGDQFDLGETLCCLLQIYKESLDRTNYLLANTTDIELDDSKSALSRVATSKEIVDEIDKLIYSNESVDEVIERLTIGALVPEKLIDRAKDIVEKMNKSFNKAEADRQAAAELSFGVGSHAIPEGTPVYNRLRQLSDNTYDMYNEKEVALNYKPDSNQ